jgi:DivIVA domain-containing protein
MATLRDTHTSLTPSSISSASFTNVRRGFDPDEVRSYLRQVAAELARALESEASLRREVEELQRDTSELDEATVAGLLGEETARVLTTAREAARSIKARAEENMERLLRTAQEDAARLREEADLDIARQRQEAADEAEHTVEDARDEGRHMVSEARAVRERMLHDLQRRRDAARRQIADLDEARQQLIELFGSTQRSVSAVLASLGATVEEPAAPEDDIDAMMTGEAVVAVVGVAEPVAESVDATHDAVLDDADAESAAMGAVVLSLVVGEPDVAPAVADAGAGAAEESDAPEVFRRIRADRADAVSRAEELLAETETSEVFDVVATGPSALERRDVALAPVTSSLAKRLKRALADEQNGVLDKLRRQGGPTIEGLVGTLDEQAERYRAAAEDELWAAATAGARSLVDDAEEADVASRLDGARVLDGALAAVTSLLVEPLRSHLERSLADAGGDSVEVASRLRATYREWKTQRFDELTSHLVLAAHGAGAFAAVEKGTPLHWVGDPTASCPDCDDNALAGAVLAGEAFPTGHSHAPAHPGCRCAITSP